MLEQTLEHAQSELNQVRVTALGTLDSALPIRLQDERSPCMIQQEANAAAIIDQLA